MKNSKNDQSIKSQTANTPAGEKTVKHKKKRKKAPIIIAIIIVLIIIWRFVACSMAGPAAVIVTTAAPVRGDLQESISTSGTVASEEQKTYFAPVAGVLGKVTAKAGDSVKKGDTLVSYDEKQLERAYKEAALQQTINSSTYQGAISDSSENQSKLNEANTNLAILDQQIADNEAYLKSLKEKMNQNQRDTSNGLSEESFNLGTKAAQLQQEMAGMDQTSPEYAAKAKELQDVNTAQSRNSYLQQVAASSSSDYAVKMQKEIDDVTERLSDYKEYKSKMESQKASSENAVMNSYEKEKNNANQEIAKMTFQKSEEDYYTAKQGITAEFDGIVTECTAVEGSSVTSGFQLLTLASSSEVKVTFSASKYDLVKLAVGQKAEVVISDNTYEGEISKINRMAAPNSSNTPMVGVEIHIMNPDDKIILGLDARIEVFTKKAENVLLVPVEAINADKDGDFLYVAENGIVVRKPVVCGISSDTYTEIIEGITENDQIILSSYGTLAEGIAVTALPGAGAAAGGSQGAVSAASGMITAE